MRIILPGKEKSLGQILISILIATTVFLILTHALFTLIASSFNLVSFNRARITARHLAQEKIELIRNLPYNNIGSEGGIPSGILLHEENLVRNGLNYLVKTDVIYIDDPFDSLAPDDTSPEDYKRARVEISWQGLATSRYNPIVLITDISPQVTQNLEGGTLRILVFNANGQPVSQAQVTIIADDITPPVNVTQLTDSGGQIILPGATPCVACYKITVTKVGFSTDRTYASSEVTNPLKPHMSVFEDDVTQVSFAIDLLGGMIINSVDSRENGFVSKGNVPVRLRGSKIIGTDAFAQPVYKYNHNLTTDSSGNLSLNSMEWDVYHVLTPLITSYDISGTSPLLPLNLTPGGSLNFTLAVSPHTNHSFFLIVKDPSQNLIASASAKLNNGVGFEETKTTGISADPDFGQAFFSSLEEKNYQLSATASGYLDFNGTFDVSGYTSGEVVLTPQ